MSDAASRFEFPVTDVPAAAVSSPEAVVKFLVGQLVESGRLRPEHADRVACQVLHRESLGSTALEGGFAPSYQVAIQTRILLHARSLAGREARGEVLWPVAASTPCGSWRGWNGRCSPRSTAAHRTP